MVPAKTTHPALYRASQFFVALFSYLPTWAGGKQGQLSSADQTLVNAILSTPPQQRLFAQMPPNDQRHAIAVARTLQQAEHTEPALMQAALLHDVGKSIGQPIFHRVAIVLLEGFWPQMLDTLSKLPENSQPADSMTRRFADSQIRSVVWWRRPFVVHAQHPAIGAEWTKNAGCDPLAVELILKHQDKIGSQSTDENTKLLVALQWADNLN